VADVAEAKLLGLLLQWGDQTFIQADGGAAFPADDVVMVVTGLLGKIKGFPVENDPLDETCFPQGFQNAVDGGAIADL